MKTENIILTLLGLVTISIALDNYRNKNVVKENFAGLSGAPMTVIRERVYGSGHKKGDFYEVPGGYQASLSPRAAGMVDYGAFIRYNLPSQDNMGVDPNNPLMPSSAINLGGSSCDCGQNNIVEGYCSGCGSQAGCRQQPDQVQGSAALGSGQGGYMETTDMLPVQNMSNGMAINALGEQVTQPIIYDRFIYANQRSRLYGLGDPIRGDLPIVPHQKGWFSPANAHPQIALRDGAVAAIAGAENTVNRELMALQSAATGGLLDTGSGVNYSVQKSSFLNTAGGDISVTAFP